VSDYEFQCCYCGHQTDGDIYHYPPDICKACGCTDFEDAEAAEEREAENRAINKEEEMRNG
jgi:hypothetical protein